jgi:hypothetical protein
MTREVEGKEDASRRQGRLAIHGRVINSPLVRSLRGIFYLITDTHTLPAHVRYTWTTIAVTLSCIYI